VIFEDISGATKAVRAMPGFLFFGKPMKVVFAKTKSDVIAKIDGTFKPRPKRKSPDSKGK
jgi:U1 small nuclear ribonucleoprotein A